METENNANNTQGVDYELFWVFFNSPNEIRHIGDFMFLPCLGIAPCTVDFGQRLLRPMVLMWTLRAGCQGRLRPDSGQSWASKDKPPKAPPYPILPKTTLMVLVWVILHVNLSDRQSCSRIVGPYDIVT